jgi:xanthine/uracil permease
MPFREKTAWLSLVGIVIAFGWYFGSLLFYFGPSGELPDYSAALLIPTIILLTVVTVVAAIALALHRPADAQAPADERDRAISRRASALAYAVLLPALFVALALAAFFRTTIVVNAVIAAVVLAEVVRCAVEIAGYRRGS